MGIFFRCKIIILLFSSLIKFFRYLYGYAQENNPFLNEENITLYDPHLKIELATYRLDFPITMEFVGIDNSLILEKNTGNVKRVINGTVLEKPLLDLTSNNPSIKDECGLLEIAITEKKNKFYKDKKYNM